MESLEAGRLVNGSIAYGPGEKCCQESAGGWMCVCLGCVSLGRVRGAILGFRVGTSGHWFIASQAPSAALATPAWSLSQSFPYVTPSQPHTGA